MEGSTSDVVMREIIETRKAIQEKCNLLKRNREETDEYLKMKYQPLLSPLKALVEKQEKPPLELKQSPKPEVATCETPLPPPKRLKFLRLESATTPPSRFTKTWHEELSTPKRPEVLKLSSSASAEATSPLQEVREQAQTPEGKEISAKYLKEVGEMSSKYIKKFIKNETKDLDMIYGVVYDGRRFSIGDSVVSISKDILSVGDNTYFGTPGLFELLFLTNPNLSMVKKTDYINYKSILQQTNAHREGHSPSGPIKVLNTNMKYKNVISKLFSTKRGAGYVDPNMLVDRLRSLLGTNNASAEIKSIEAQLRDGGIIA